jgi:hypothetical protein
MGGNTPSQNATGLNGVPVIGHGFLALVGQRGDLLGYALPIGNVLRVGTAGQFHDGFRLR